MCSSFSTASALKVAALCGGRMPEFSYSAECYPGRDSPIIIADESGELVPVRAGFGMLPHWANVKLARQTYNARSETVADKPSFRNAWKKKQTCLVPVQEFFEPNYESGKPVRWGIGRKDGELTLLAGLWEMRKGEDGQDQRTFTMLTISGEGHPIMSRMHAPEDEKRSVVPLEIPDWPLWLRPDDHDAMRALLRPFPAELYSTWAKPLVRKPKAEKPTVPPEQDDLIGT